MNTIKTKMFEPVTIGAWNLKTRTAMAPMTRSFADNETGVVNDLTVEYYRKRAQDGIGLIITEGVVISPRAKGNPGSSRNIYSRANQRLEKSNGSSARRRRNDYCANLACGPCKSP